jgi:hypothetical protein
VELEELIIHSAALEAANFLLANPGDDPFTIRGKKGVLRRGEDGFASLAFTDGDGSASQYSLNDAEERMVEKLWKAWKDGTQTVKNRHLLQAAKRIRTLTNSMKKFPRHLQARTARLSTADLSPRMTAGRLAESLKNSDFSPRFNDFPYDCPCPPKLRWVPL